VFFSLFLIYPVVASTVLRLWVCKTVNGVDYLLADFHNVCYDERWNRYAHFGAVMILFYPIGIPILFAIKLTANRKLMQRPGVKAALGFFYGSFYPSAWWFELVDITHKLILVSLIAFFPPDLQLPFAMTFIQAYLIIILLVHPYKQDTDDRLHLQAQIALFLYLYAGFMLQRATVSDATEIVLDIILIGLMIALLLFAGFYVGGSVWARVKETRIAKNYLAERTAKQYGAAEEDVHGNVKHIEMNVLDRQVSAASHVSLQNASRADLMSRQVSAQEIVRVHAQAKLPSGLVLSQIEERKQQHPRNSLSMNSDASAR